MRNVSAARIVALALLGTSATGVNAAVSLTNTSYSQNFNTLATSGTRNSSLPTGFVIDERGTGATGLNNDDLYAAGTGSDNQGNTYSFGAAGSTERALGSLTSGASNPNLFGAFFTNGLNGIIESFDLSYFGEQWRKGGTTGRDQLTFAYSTNATDRNLIGGTWTEVSALNFLSPQRTSGAGALNGNADANRSFLSATISGLQIASGGTFAIRWTDSQVSGANNGLAIDDLSLTANLAPVAAVPEPATWAMMIGGFGMVGGMMRRRNRQAVRAVHA